MTRNMTRNMTRICAVALVNLYYTHVKFLCKYTKCTNLVYFFQKPLDICTNLVYNINRRKQEEPKGTPS